VALSEFEVVQRLEVEVGGLADLAQGDVVLVGLAVRGLGLGDVRELAEEFVAPPVELDELGLELLELGLERARGLPGLLEARIVGLPCACGLLDLRRELVLLRPDRVDPGVELAAALVDLDQLIELLRRPAPGQR
jgi:hypothetical protein